MDYSCSSDLLVKAGERTGRRESVAGLSAASIATRRVQRMVAGIVVIVPLVGTLVAILQTCLVGVGWLELGVLGFMYPVCILGATVGFHRHFTHRAFQAHPTIRVALAIVGSMAAQGPMVYWVASHRRHHQYSDQPGDPHSPNLHGAGWRGLLNGLWHAHVGWMFSSELTDWQHFAQDTLRDQVAFWAHRTYFRWVLLGLALPAALGGLIAQSWLGAAQGFLWGGLVRIFLVNHAAWCVGSVCHVFGSRPFDNRDLSANNFLVALATFGEGLQNNHHAFPSSAAHGLAWWEPDFSMWFIRALEAVGLVWDVKVPSAQMIAAKRSE